MCIILMKICVNGIGTIYTGNIEFYHENRCKENPMLLICIVFKNQLRTLFM